MKILIDPYFISIVVIIGILMQGIPAIYQIYLTKTTFSKNVVVSIAQIRRLSDLFIELRGTPTYLKLKDQFYLIFRIKNYGTREITKSDFLKNLEINTGKKSVVKDFRVLKKPTSSSLPGKFKNSKITFNKFILNPGDVFSSKSFVKALNFNLLLQGGSSGTGA